MRPADRAFVRPRAIAWTPSVITGWGQGQGASVTIVRPEGVGELRVALRSAAHLNAIPRGMGRSYGDAAQISGGLVIETTRLKRIELDGERGTVTAQAGVTIGELLREVVPAGWMVPVVPGTQHVTVGGAIASDIHGKNHGTAGTFGTHVEAISLLRADGELVELQPGMSDGQFEATLGGMGLTGIIMDARVKLRPDPGRDAVGRHRPGPLAGRCARGTRGARRPIPGRVARLAVRVAGTWSGDTRGAHRCPRRGRGGRALARDRAARLARRRAPAGDGSRTQRSQVRERAAEPSEAGPSRSAGTCSRSTRSTHGRACTVRAASSSTSWLCRPAQSACLSSSSSGCAGDGCRATSPCSRTSVPRMARRFRSRSQGGH